MQRAGCDTRSIFKRTTIGLNLEFSFSKIGSCKKAKEHSLPCYLPIRGGEEIDESMYLARELKKSTLLGN